MNIIPQYMMMMMIIELKALLQNQIKEIIKSHYSWRNTKFSVLQSQVVKPTSSWKPRSSEKKCTSSILQSFISSNHFSTLPSHSSVGVSTRSSVPILQIQTCLQCKISRPRHVSSWLNEITQCRLHDHSSRILLPWSPQECWNLEPLSEQLLFWDDSAVVDH